MLQTLAISNYRSILDLVVPLGRLTLRKKTAYFIWTDYIPNERQPPIKHL